MKDIITLGIESSCDETSVAIVKNGREVLSNVINTQIAIHTQFGGVVPEIASRQHVENISNVAKEALKEAILNGVNNLKYIDRILYEWNKKGYKKPSDVVKKRQVKEEKIDLFDYDWLDEE